MWEIEDRKRIKTKKSKKPTVLITPVQFKFNGAFVQQLTKDGIDWYRYITVHVDKTQHKLGFLFHNEDEYPGKRRIARQNGTMAISSYKLIHKYSWLRDIANNVDPEKRKFELIKDGELYCINV
jgi:hypothetical protein